MDVKKHFLEYESFLFNKDYRYYNERENIGGMGEDNDMTSYKYDILFTRLKFKRIAEYKEFEKPYKFKRINFRWIKDKNNLQYWLLGQLKLIDKYNRRELVSSDLTWMRYEDPIEFVKYNHFWEKNEKKYYLKLLNRYKTMKMNLTRLGVLKNG